MSNSNLQNQFNMARAISQRSPAKDTKFVTPPNTITEEQLQAAARMAPSASKPTTQPAELNPAGPLPAANNDNSDP